MEKRMNVYEAKNIILDDEKNAYVPLWRRRATDGLGRIGLPHVPVLIALTPAFYVAETCVYVETCGNLSPVTSKQAVEVIL
jgi:hypothetical protein